MIYNELLTKWQHVLDRVNICTWTEILTLAFLAELASKSLLIVEVGTYLGASAKVMLLANPRLRLYCIDTFACKEEPMMVEYLDKIGVVRKDLTTWEICHDYSLKQEVKEGRCRLIVGDSEIGSRQLPLMKFDGCFIDDGHATEDVLRDIRCLMPFLKSGGEMVGHDFDQNPYNDVARGVIASGISYDVPIPRMWRHTKL